MASIGVGALKALTLYFIGRDADLARILWRVLPWNSGEQAMPPAHKQMVAELARFFARSDSTLLIPFSKRAVAYVRAKDSTSSEP